MKKYLVSLLAGMFLVVGNAYSQKTYQYIIPTAPGTVSDLISRAIIDEYQKQTVNKIMLENIPGGDFIPAINRFKSCKTPCVIATGTAVQITNFLTKDNVPYSPEDFEHIAWFKELVADERLKLNLYAMLMDSPENRNFAAKNGPYQFKNLSIRSFKCFADGALGSRGALLKAPYHDHSESRGLLLTEVARMQNLAQFCLQHNYQMNTHSIGDSANALVLNLYASIYKQKPDHRFRIEHAQVVDPIDFQKFANFAVFPSVQPTHAVSDSDWAEARLGKKRMKGAYAYKTLLQQFGMLALGTDFPVEQTNPFLTIQAAVNHSTTEALTLDEVLKGMTIWAAFAAFQEKELGSLEKGKQATFVIFENPVTADQGQVQNYAWRTFIKGKCVFKLEAL